MAKKPPANTVEKAPPKPKQVSQVTLTVHDDGKITGDFYIWEENEVGKRKKWTVGGTDFFKYLNRVQPKNVPVLASAMNVQIVLSGLSEKLQGPWVKRDTAGKLSLAQGNYLETDRPPGDSTHADRIADSEATKAAEAIALNQ